MAEHGIAVESTSIDRTAGEAGHGGRKGGMMARASSSTTRRCRSTAGVEAEDISVEAMSAAGYPSDKNLKTETEEREIGPAEHVQARKRQTKVQRASIFSFSDPGPTRQRVYVWINV